MIFQIGMSSLKHCGKRSLPYAFTEQGGNAGIDSNPKAINVNSIIRISVKSRRSPEEAPSLTDERRPAAYSVTHGDYGIKIVMPCEAVFA